ncbi:hypothetical protein JHK84_048167 [Glycine max]|nr:hypothetical protein JHK85_048760 [Glycine max]KAG5103198.1 hypothetical protein JHK84_048167 [Glycine max]
MKHKLSDLEDIGVLPSSGKRLNAGDLGFYSPTCPILSVNPHVCAKPKQSLGDPSNVTSRLGTREFKFMYGGVHGNRRDRQFVYSRFRPSGKSVDAYSLTCITFLGDSSFIAVGSDHADLYLTNYTSLKNCEEPCCEECHNYPMTLIQSFITGDSQLLLSSSSQDITLWDASSILSDYVWDECEKEIHLFHGCKATRFSHSGNFFAALSQESAQQGILLYDIQTCQLESNFSDTSTTFAGQAHLYSPIHFSHSDSMLLWNGVLRDRRVSGPIHRFDQFTDFGGGGFHPAGNEVSRILHLSQSFRIENVIINSEVWDLRKFRLLHSVPSLDQRTITFNAHGDVIYAILRRNIENVMSAFHPCNALDFATDPTDSFVGFVTISKRGNYVEGRDEEGTLGCVRIFELVIEYPSKERMTIDDEDGDFIMDDV